MARRRPRVRARRERRTIAMAERAVGARKVGERIGVLPRMRRRRRVMPIKAPKSIPVRRIRSMPPRFRRRRVSRI